MLLTLTYQFLNVILNVNIISKVPGWNYGGRAPFTKTAGKAQGLWNCQNRRTVAANQIKEAIGKKLQTPGVTRWNSYYDSCAALLEVLEDRDMMEKLNAVMLKQSLPYLYSTDKDLLAQYCKIMKPVATCLDTLQSEVNAYMGILLPTIKLMKDQVADLRRDNSIVEGQALITYLLENPQNPRVALKGRFEKMFEDKDLLVATALHPHFKLSVVGYLNPALKGDIKRQIVRQMVIRASPGETGGETGQMQKEDEEDPFKYMRDDDDLLATKGVLEEDIEKAYDEWNRIRVNSKLRVSYDQFPLLHRVAWLDMFLKYNTPLPSSAAVERLFSSGSDILRPKRSNLTADNFEKLVFIKGNLPLLS